MDFHILLWQLETTDGIGGRALGWFSSFLSDWRHIVTYACKRSSSSRLICGVPQGSALGPLLSGLYAAVVVTIAQDHGVNVHSYADRKHERMDVRLFEVLKTDKQTEEDSTSNTETLDHNVV